MLYRTKKSGYKNNNKTRKLNNKNPRKNQTVLKGGNIWGTLDKKTRLHNYDFSTSEKNYQKNRYRDILAQESTLVKLENDGYINANYIYSKQNHITTFFDMFKKLIATQGPMTENKKLNKIDTINDFWNMLKKEQIDVVVMLCNLTENGRSKCDNYYTIFKELNETKNLGTTERLLHMPIQTIGNHEYSLTQYNFTKWPVKEYCFTKWPVKQYQFTEWPDHGVPSSNDCKTKLYKLVDHIMTNYSYDNVVVHCSAGVGRTGTFIMMCYLYKYYKIDKNNVLLNPNELADIVFELRKLRNKYMVQTDEQFNFILDYNEHLKPKELQPQSQTKTQRTQKSQTQRSPISEMPPPIPLRSIKPQNSSQMPRPRTQRTQKSKTQRTQKSQTQRSPIPLRSIKPQHSSQTPRPPIPSPRTIKPQHSSQTRRPPIPSPRTPRTQKSQTPRKPIPSPRTQRPPIPSRKDKPSKLTRKNAKTLTSSSSY